MARKIEALQVARAEVLVLTTARRLRGWIPELEAALTSAAKRGVHTKLFLSQSTFLPCARLRRLKAAGVEVRKASSHFWQLEPALQDEVWTFDRESTLAGHSDTSAEIASHPSPGRMLVECAFTKDVAQTAGRYFDHRWDGQPDGVALIVRHKQFTFRGGKGAEQEFFSCLNRAKREIHLCLTECRISTKLFRALREARRAGIHVVVFANPLGIRRLRNRVLFAKLLREGAEVRFTFGHLLLESPCAVIDKAWVYLGRLPGARRPWSTPASTVFFVWDPKLGMTLCGKLSRHLGRSITRINSDSYLSSPPATLTPAPQRNM